MGRQRSETAVVAVVGDAGRPLSGVIRAGTAVEVTRVAMYVRISTDDEHQPFSVDAQRERLSAYLRSQPGWVAAGPIYRDEKSGATMDRPGLQQALAAARAGEFDVLLVYRVDRLARSLRTLVAVLDDLAAAGVGLRSVTEPIDTSSAVGRLLIQMLGVFAQFEREIIIDRVVCGMERKAATGRWTGGPWPYGYRLDEQSDNLVPDPDQAPIVRQIFGEYTEQSRGIRAIAARLNARGMRTRSGRAWSGDTIRRILANRAYLGEKAFRDVRATAAHEPLVDQATFDRAQQILTLRARKPSGPTATTTSDYLLSGVVTCAACGGRYVGTAAKGRHLRYRYYTCLTRSRYGTATCAAPRLRADRLEALVISTIAGRYQHTDLVSQAITLIPITSHAERDAHRAELGVLARQLSAIRVRTDRYLKAFEDDVLPAQLCADRLAELADQSAKLTARRRELRRALQGNPTSADAAAPSRPLGDLTAVLARADVRQMKSLIGLLVADIRVHGRHQIVPYLRAQTATS